MDTSEIDKITPFVHDFNLAHSKKFGIMIKSLSNKIIFLYVDKRLYALIEIIFFSFDK